jgi:hypothetical protein
MMDGDLSKRPALDKQSRLILEELDLHLSAELWHDFDNPLHDLLLRDFFFLGYNIIRFIVTLW